MTSFARGRRDQKVYIYSLHLLDNHLHFLNPLTSHTFISPDIPLSCPGRRPCECCSTPGSARQAGHEST